MATVYFTSIRVGGGSSRKNREAIEHTLLLSVQDNQEVERRILLETEITERQQIAVAFLQQPTLTALRKVHDELRASQEYRLLIAAKASRSRVRQMRRATQRYEDRTQRRVERKREEAIEATEQRQLKREKQQRKRAREERRMHQLHQRLLGGRNESDGSTTLTASSSSIVSNDTSKSSSRMRTFSTSSTSSSDSGADTSETSFEDSGSSSTANTTSSESSSGNSSTSSALFRRDRRLKRREARLQQVKGPRPRELQAVSDAIRDKAFEYEEKEGTSKENSTKRSFPHMIQLSSQEAISVFKLLWSDIEAQVVLAVEQRRRRREEEMLKAQLERARYSGISIHANRPSNTVNTTSPNYPTHVPPRMPSGITTTTTTSSAYNQNQRAKLLELKMQDRWGGDQSDTSTAVNLKPSHDASPFSTATNFANSTHDDDYSASSNDQHSLRTQISSIEAMLSTLHRADANTIGTSSCSAELLMAKRRIAKGPSHTTLRKELITGLRSTGGGGTTSGSSRHHHQKPSAASATAAIASDVLTGGGGVIGGHHTKLRLDTLKAIRRRVMDEIKVDMEQQAHPSATGTYPSDLHDNMAALSATRPATGAPADTSARSDSSHHHHFGSVGIVSDILKAKEEEHRIMVAMLAEQSPSRNRPSTTNPPTNPASTLGKRRASASSTPGGGGMRTSSSRSLTSVSGFGAGVALLQALERAVPRENFASLSKQLSESVYTLYKIWGAYYHDVRSQENGNLSQCARDAAEASSPQKNLWYKGWGDRKAEETARAATQIALDNTTATSALFTRLLCRLLSFDDPLATMSTSSHHHHYPQTDDPTHGSSPSRDSYSRYVFYQKSSHNTNTFLPMDQHGATTSSGDGGVFGREAAWELGVTILHEASQVMTEYPLLAELSILPFNSPKASPVTMSLASKMEPKSGDIVAEEATYCVQLLDVEVSAACSYHTFHSILKTLASILYPERSPLVASQLLAATLVRRSHGALK